MLDISVVQYEKGDRQTQKSAGEKTDEVKKKSKNQYKNLEAILRHCHVHQKYIKIFKIWVKSWRRGHPAAQSYCF